LKRKVANFQGMWLHVRVSSAVSALVAAAVIVAGADSWPRFRGPNGAGVGTEAPIPARFSATENLVWRAALPPGHSSPVLSDKRVFLTAVDGDALVTIALDRRSGVIAWEARADRPRQQAVDKRNHPASPTPATDGENVYVFFQDVGLLAYDASGRQRWRVPLGPFTNTYGMGASPIVAGELVVLVCDQSAASFMIAVDRASGAVRWRVERPEATSGHSTPVILERPGGAPQLLVPGSFYLTAYELASGKKLWWSGGLAFEMKATPVHDGTTVFISGTSTSSFEDSYGHNIPAFDDVRSFDKNGDGRFSREELPDDLARRWLRLLDLDGDSLLDRKEWTRYRDARRSAGGLWAFRAEGENDMTGRNAVWHYDRAVPQLPSPLLYKGLLYIVNDGGILTALDPVSGKVAGQRRLQDAADSYYASPVAADGKILLVSELGKVSVVKAGADLEVLAVNDLGDLAYATPALADGHIYIRTRGALYCFGR
jgi:outer membrane protein assembly factor BamB